MKADIIKGEILPDGSIKFTTDPISAANHTSASNMLRSLCTLAGGLIDTKRRHGHTHSHGHAHEHEHGGEHHHH